MAKIRQPSVNATMVCLENMEKKINKTSSLPTRLIVAISSRALFNLDESNNVFEKEGIDAYARYQIERESDILKPGVAFPVVKKLLNLNQRERLVDIILLSRNNADTGLRIFNSIQHYNLDIR